MYNRLQKEFTVLNIRLKEKITDNELREMPESITNQFMQVDDVNGKQYLVRINGKLWPPFTRENEDFNIKQLKENNINNTIIANNLQQGFQICLLDHDKNRFSQLSIDKKSDYVLSNIALTIKKIHQVTNFKNHYPIANTIHNSMKRLPETAQKNLHDFMMPIFSMLCTLHADQKNKVSSHNDLLPSSVYINEHDVTFVDWEYSAENHRSYDLAFFSLKSSLTREEEQKLVAAYDPNNEFNTSYSVTMMKPIVNFLLLLWNNSAKKENKIAAEILLQSLYIHTQEAFCHQSGRKLLTEMKFSLFHRKNDLPKAKKFLSTEVENHKHFHMSYLGN